MKKYFLFIGYLLSVACLFFAIDLSVPFTLDKAFFLDNDPKLKYIYEENEKEDLAIVGASRALCHYIPAILSKELNMTCYNYGIGGRNIYNHYIVTKELLNHNKKPKLILFEVASIDVMDTPGWNGEKLSNMYPLYKKDPDVKIIVDHENKEDGIALRYLNLYRYNSNLLGLFRATLLGVEPIAHNGYKPLYSSWESDIEVLEDEYPTVSTFKECYLRKNIESCKNAGVGIVFYNSPEFKRYKNNTAWEKHIETICREYDIPFINHAHDSLFLSHKDWFNEPVHLNDEGAHVYTSIVSQELKQILQ